MALPEKDRVHFSDALNVEFESAIPAATEPWEYAEKLARLYRLQKSRIFPSAISTWLRAAKGRT